MKHFPGSESKVWHSVKQKGKDGQEAVTLRNEVSLVVKMRIADVIDSLLFFTETSWNLSSFTGNDLQLINSTDTLHLQILDL